MEAQGTEIAPETATSEIVEPAAGKTPPSPQLERSDQASPSSAARTDDGESKEAKREAKKKRDAKRAAVRRRLEDLENCSSVEELEQKLLGRVKPQLTAIPGGAQPSSPAAAAPALQLIPTAAPPKPIWPSKDQVEPWKEPLQQLLTACNTLAALKLPAPYPLEAEEVKKLGEALAPVAAKHLPDALNSPEAALIAVAIAIALPRILHLVMNQPAPSKLEDAPPPGKAAA